MLFLVNGLINDMLLISYASLIADAHLSSILRLTLLYLLFKSSKIVFTCGFAHAVATEAAATLDIVSDIASQDCYSI